MRVDGGSSRFNCTPLVGRAEDARVKLVSGAKASCRLVFRANPVYNSRTAPSGWNPRRTFHPNHLPSTADATTTATLSRYQPSTRPVLCAFALLDFAGAAVCEVNYRRIIALYMPTDWLTSLDQPASRLFPLLFPCSDRTIVCPVIMPHGKPLSFIVRLGLFSQRVYRFLPVWELFLCFTGFRYQSR